MASDRIDTKAWRDLNAQLNRIALAGERIADALEKYVENDPLAAVTKALEAETQVDRSLWRCPKCEVMCASYQIACPNCNTQRPNVPDRIDTQTYGSDLPESERWRLGS